MTEPTVWAKAKDVLWERGWCKGCYEDDRGSVCLMGACMVAATGVADPGGTLDGVRVEDEYTADFNAHTGVERISVGSWNDAPGRTFDDVLDILDELDKAERS